MEHTPAIVLRKSAWSETSLIITWLTEKFGAVRTVARGARKSGSPLAGKIDVFFTLEISIALSGKSSLHTLCEANVLSAFDAARAGSAGFYLAAYFSELAGLVAPPMQPSAEIYDLLKRGVAYVQREPASEKALNHFEKELCRILGVHDATGSVAVAEALASLCGQPLRSRASAMSFLGGKGNSRHPDLSGHA